MTHIDDMAAFVRGELGSAETAAAREHLAVCVECREESEAIEAAFAAMELVAIEPRAEFAHRTALKVTPVKPAIVRRGVWDRVSEIVTRRVFGYPAWALSAAVHLLALGVLTLIMVERYERPQSADEPFLFAKVPPNPDVARPNETAGTVPQEGEFASFLARRGDDASRKALLEKWGGLETAGAVDRGLDWLSAKQEKDGSFPVEGGLPVYKTAVTGLATLALLGHGDSHVAGEHREAVSKAIAYLKSQQGRTGRIGPDNGAVLPQHAIATAALAEAFAMTGDASLREPVVGAVEYLAAAHHPNGGWGASFTSAPDAVTTAWSIQALRIADAAGIPGAKALLPAAASFLDGITGPDGRTGMRAAGAFPNGWETPTAAALFARLWTGLDGKVAFDRASALSEAAPRGDSLDYVGIQFGALASIGGPKWTEWNAAMKSALLPRQNADGSFKSDKWSGYGGSVYSTAMATLALETYFRFPA